MQRRSDDAKLLMESFDEVVPRGDELVIAIHRRLLSAHPELASMLPDGDTMLMAMVDLVRHYDSPADLMQGLSKAGVALDAKGATLEHYAFAGAALLGALGDFLGEAWTPEVRGAWTRAYTFAAGTMAMAGAA